jgi:hypothetical protein
VLPGLLSACSPDAGQLGAAPDAVAEDVPATAQQSLVAEGSADALGNSPRSAELSFVSRLGFMDGTTCEAWPRQVSLTDTAPSGALSLATITTSLSNGTLKSIVSGFREKLEERGLSDLAAVGAKSRLRIERVYGAGPVTGYRAVAIDSETRKGYVIDSQYFCHPSNVKSGDCSTESVTTSIGAVEILYRTRPRGRVPGILLVAPRVEIPSSITLNSHVVLVADEVAGGQLQGTAPPAFVPATLTVVPWEDTSDWRTRLQKSSYQPGLLLVAANKITGLPKARVLPNRINKVVVDDAFSDVPADPFELRLTPQQALQATSDPTWVYDHDEILEQRYLGEYKTSSYVYGRYYRGRASYAGIPDVSAGTAVQGGDAIVVAASGDPVSVEAPGHDRHTLEIDYYALNALTSSLFSRLNALSFERPPYARTHYNGGGIITVDSDWYKIAPYKGCERKSGTDETFCSIASVPEGITISIGDYQSGVGHAYNGDVVGKDVTDLFDHHLRSRLGVRGTSAASSYAAGAARSERVPANVAAGLALIMGRGLYFDQMFARAENASLRTGGPSAYWTTLGEQTRPGLLKGLSSRPDAAKAVFGIPAEKQAVAQGWGAYLVTQQRGLNALGLPYGASSEPWKPALGSPARPASLEEVETRYASVASLVEDLNAVAETQRTDKRIDDVAAALSQTVSQVSSFMGTVEAASESLAGAAEANAVVQESSVGNLQSTLDEVERNQRYFDESVRRIWECDAGADFSLCVAHMQDTLSQLDRQCQAEGNKTDFGRVLLAAAKFVPYVNIATEVISSDAFKAALDMSDEAWKTFTTHEIDDMLVASELLGKLDTVAQTYEEVNDLLSSTDDAQNASATIHQMVMAGLPACGDTSLREKARTQLQDLAELDATMQAFATDLRTLSGLLDSLQGHIRYLTVSKDNFKRLEAEAANARAALSALDPGASLVTSQSARAAYLQAACYTTLAANRALQNDLHHVSQMLQTTTGGAVTKASLVVPAEPRYLGATASSEKSWGYLVSLWEPQRFGRRLAADGSSQDSFLGRAVSRFQRYHDEVCSVTADGVPNTRFLVRKQITGSDLRRLWAGGKLDVHVTLDDVVRGGNAIRDNMAGVAVKIGTAWVPLSAPIVMDVRYSACTGPAEDPCCAHCRTDLSAVPAIGRLRGAVVPKAACSEPFEVPTRVAPINGRVTTCLAPVSSPVTAWPLAWVDASGAESTLVSSLFGAQCAMDAGSVRWDQQGLPLLGQWTVMRDEAAMNAVLTGGRPAVRWGSPAVKGLELVFAVTAEPESRAAEQAAYRLSF